MEGEGVTKAEADRFEEKRPGFLVVADEMEGAAA